MEISLWHGGRELEHSYKNNHSSAKGRWEHGAGLYLTTHYETARKYSKGNGKTYEVVVNLDPEKSIGNTKVSIESVLNFYSKNIKKSTLKECCESLNKAMNRMNNNEMISAESFQNIIINHEAMVNSKTNLITDFLIENGIQYGIVKNYGGRDETVLVVYDKNIITSVKPIPSKNVDINLFERYFPESDWKMILPEIHTKKLKI